MKDSIEQKCIDKGVKLTDQRKVIAKVMSESDDHPDVSELYKRVSIIDSKISIATVYRTVKLFEDFGILTKPSGNSISSTFPLSSSFISSKPSLASSSSSLIKGNFI